MFDQSAPLETDGLKSLNLAHCLDHGNLPAHGQQPEQFLEILLSCHCVTASKQVYDGALARMAINIGVIDVKHSRCRYPSVRTTVPNGEEVRVKV